MLKAAVQRPPEKASALPVDRPIRVARVITRLNVGGPAQQAILLAAGLDRTRFRTTLITGVVGRDEGDLAPAARTRGVEPVVIPELGRPVHPLHDLLALGKLVRLFRHLQPDVVHTHTAKAGTLGRLAARLTAVPATIHTFHGHVLEGYFSPAVSQLFLRIERGLARRTDRIIALSLVISQLAFFNRTSELFLYILLAFLQRARIGIKK